MRKCRLTEKERAFLQSIMDSAIPEIQTRDMRKCCEYACRVIHSSSLAKRKLRVVVMAQIDSHGVLFFKRLFEPVQGTDKTITREVSVCESYGTGIVATY
jgi:hypothetical protein